VPKWDAYEQHHRSVRRALRRFGVVDADLDDVCHDVFLVALARANELRLMSKPEIWLFEVARRTASAHRRRAFRRSEIPSADPERMAPLEHAEPGFEHGADGRLREALLLLEPQRREMLLYADLTDVSVSDLALLLECDRKTARRRLLAARRRIEQLLRDPVWVGGSQGRPAEPADEALLFDPQRVAPADVDTKPSPGLRVIAQSPTFAAAVLGRVFMTVWRRASLEEIEIMASAAARVYHASGGQFAYLTLVEAGCPPPPFSSRSRLLQIVREAGRHLSSYATVLTSDPSAMVVPIMNVVFYLTGTAFPVRFFRSVSEATHWTLERTVTELSPAELAGAFEALRQCVGPLS
jgi:RNA polymerase sigma-70 factor, ECF subfamily